MSAIGRSQRRIGILETEANRLQTAEIGALKERCRKIEHEQLKSDRKWPQFMNNWIVSPKLELELRSSNERIEFLERKLNERDYSVSECRTGPFLFKEKEEAPPPLLRRGAQFSKKKTFFHVSASKRSEAKTLCKKIQLDWLLTQKSEASRPRSTKIKTVRKLNF